MKRIQGVIWGAVFLLGMGPIRAQAAIWKAAGQIGMIAFYAELDDEEDPATVMLRIENHSKLKSFTVSRYFVQMMDAENQRVRPISSDEVVSENLRKLRQLMPRHEAEINKLLGEIQADYPQEKIVEVYGRLKEYMQRGRPIAWRTQVENWLLGKQASQTADLETANRIIEAIGILAKNYFWPTDITPDSNYTGMVYFDRPTRQPVNIFFQIGDEFIGTKMTLVASDKKKSPPNK